MFLIVDLRQAVDTAKRILTKEKIGKQLTGQTCASPFMSIREGTDKRVSFNTKDELRDKIDKLTVVMSKVAVKDSHERKPFKPQVYKSRGQNRSYGDRIRCYACREYDHFVRDCPNSRKERDLEQLQHMLNMEEQDHRSPSTHSSDEDCRSPSNL